VIVSDGPLRPLRSPVLIAAFGGWNDAGEAASGVIAHLDEVFNGEPLATLDSEDYFDYQVNRPMITIAESGIREIAWPTVQFSVVAVPGAERDLVLLRSPEPSMRWRAFCEEVLEVVRALGVQLVVTTGALLADAPHTRPVPVTGTSSDPTVAQRLGVEMSAYEGPTGIVGVLQQACLLAGLDAVSLWAAVPFYYQSSPSTKATVALMGRIEDLLDIAVPLGDLVEEARAWQLGVDELAADDEDVADYVRGLEEAQSTADLPEASGEQIAREFERFLRRRGSEGS
jgi:proteasome assembly chaperone (PAC2) family protein